MGRIILTGLCLLICSGEVWAQNTQTEQSTEETIPKTEFEELKDTVFKLKQELQEVKDKQTVPQPATPTGSTIGPLDPYGLSGQNAGLGANVDNTGLITGFGAKYLSLPDISFIVQAKGKSSSDNRDNGSDRIRLSEAELAIQGFVYPNVKADAFITMSPEEDAPAQVEEAYLTSLGLVKGLNLYIGQKHVSFGRTNILHNHSWQYVNQPLALRNLVADESLTGEGVNVSYIVPTSGDLFAQIDLGTWTGQGPGETSDLPGIMKGPGANFSDRFNTARLWTSYPITENGEFEIGGSYAGGGADGTAVSGYGHAQLTGVDLSYRYFGEGVGNRLLLRAELISRRETAESSKSTANGYYLFGNYRWNRYSSAGILYDWSEFPQSPDLHESAVSLILTRSFTEQFYIRLQMTHGSRPGDNSYNEALVQVVWGIGPHSHNLE